MSIVRKLFKYLIALLLTLCVLVVLTVLAGRYYFAPRLDQWRPELVTWLQENVHSGLSFNEMSLSWDKAFPQLLIKQVALLDDNGEVGANIDTITIDVDYLSFLKLSPQLNRIYVQGAHLVIERNQRGEISVGGKTITDNQDALVLEHTPELETNPEFIEPWVKWGFERLPQRMEIEGGHIIWRDNYGEKRPDLIFSPVNFKAQHDAHTLVVNAQISPPEQAGSMMTIDGDFNRDGYGQLELGWQDWYPQHFKKWLHFPLFMKQGKIEKAHLAVSFNRFLLKQFNAKGILNDFIFLEKDREDNALVLQGEQVTIQLSSTHGLEHPFLFDISSDKLHVQADDFFRHAMDFDAIRMTGAYDLLENEHIRLDFSQFSAALPYGSFEVKGSWRSVDDSRNGLIDLQGQIARMELNKLPNYLPKAIDADSLDWLEKAFLKGYMEGAQVSVQGNIDYIPFGLHPELGSFQIKGPVKDVELHYHQFPSQENTYWPNIYVPEAIVDFYRQDILIRGDTLSLDAALGLQGMKTRAAEVAVKNIEKNTTVHLKATLETTGEDFLRFYHQSPLRAILNKALDKTVMSGKMNGHLDIVIPIMDPDSTKVLSHFEVADTSFQFTPDHPVLSQGKGNLKITEKNVQLESIQARLLGGAVTLTGNIGAKGDRLQLNGQFSASGLYEYLPLPGIKKRVKGSASYQAYIDFLGGDLVDVNLQSNLNGLSIDLPQGLSKPAKQAVPLSAKLIAPRKGQAEQLHIDYKNRWLRVVLERVNRQKNQFNRGVIAINSEPKLPKQAMALRLNSGSWDVMTWLEFVDEFSLPKQPRQQESLFPDMRFIELDVDKLSIFGVEAKQVQLKGEKQARNWMLTLNSPQAKGQLKLVPTSDNKSLAEVDAVFNTFKLYLTEDELAESAPFQSRRIDLPHVSAKVDNFYWENQALGYLDFKGQRLSKNEWKLQQLSLNNDVGSAFATGTLQSGAKSTQAFINLNVNALNMGKFLAYFGYKDIFSEGRGRADLSFYKNDVSKMGWDDSEIKGKLRIENGSLLQLNSASLRILRLVSLQSFTRLGGVGSSTPGIMSKGLPFEYLRSAFEIKNQRLSFEDFRLDGPLVAIVAAGRTDLSKKTLDFQAAAVPKLEMSGTAVLAGIIVNPVVGVGAFLSQWLLAEPLNRSLTSHFHITGTWDTPLINNKALPTEQDLKEKRKQQEIDALYRN